ncbi:MAG: hypothetical protein HF973_17450 [Chloroflexi bacterium]|nr:hypothetical protein [Chloroflexota bacterium]
MSQENEKKIGLIIGEEWEWPKAFMQAVNQRPEPVSAELVKLSGTFVDDTCPYDVIVDRISHIVPYYRAYLKFAALHGVFIINNPFTWSADSRFYDKALLKQLGYRTPRTVILPNKHIKRDATPDTFRNLGYPMDWQAIIDYVGVPAIFKDNHTGGRPGTYRVHNVDELLTWYDESGTRTKILQQLIPADRHIHCFVVGQEQVMALEFSPEDGRYLPDILSLEDSLGQAARRISRAYEYDINMVEFVIRGDDFYVINGSNPAPELNRKLMAEAQFDWCLREIVNTAVQRVLDPPPQKIIPVHKNS